MILQFFLFRYSWLPTSSSWVWFISVKKWESSSLPHANRADSGHNSQYRLQDSATSTGVYIDSEASHAIGLNRIWPFCTSFIELFRWRQRMVCSVASPMQNSRYIHMWNNILMKCLRWIIVWCHAGSRETASTQRWIGDQARRGRELPGTSNYASSRVKAYSSCLTTFDDFQFVVQSKFTEGILKVSVVAAHGLQPRASKLDVAQVFFRKDEKPSSFVEVWLKPRDFVFQTLMFDDHFIFWCFGFRSSVASLHCAPMCTRTRPIRLGLRVSPCLSNAARQPKTSSSHRLRRHHRHRRLQGRMLLPMMVMMALRNSMPRTIWSKKLWRSRFGIRIISRKHFWAMCLSRCCKSLRYISKSGSFRYVEFWLHTADSFNLYLWLGWLRSVG